MGPNRRLYIYLTNREQDFLDPNAPDDALPETLLSQLEAYSMTTGWNAEEHGLTSNYRLARYLHVTDVCGLGTKCLGECLQIVHVLCARDIIGHQRSARENDKKGAPVDKPSGILVKPR